MCSNHSPLLPAVKVYYHAHSECFAGTCSVQEWRKVSTEKKCQCRSTVKKTVFPDRKQKQSGKNSLTKKERCSYRTRPSETFRAHSSVDFPLIP